MSRKRILIVDDQNHVRRALVRALATDDVEVLEASDFAEAMDVCSGCESLDLLVTDVSLGARSGLELARELVSRKQVRHVLYVSGWPRETAEEWGLAADAAFLEKPFSAASFVACVSGILAGSCGARAALRSGS